MEESGEVKRGAAEEGGCRGDDEEGPGRRQGFFGVRYVPGLCRGLASVWHSRLPPRLAPRFSGVAQTFAAAVTPPVPHAVTQNGEVRGEPFACTVCWLRRIQGGGSRAKAYPPPVLTLRPLQLVPLVAGRGPASRAPAAPVPAPAPVAPLAAPQPLVAALLPAERLGRALPVLPQRGSPLVQRGRAEAESTRALRRAAALAGQLPVTRAVAPAATLATAAAVTAAARLAAGSAIIRAEASRVNRAVAIVKLFWFC